MKIVADENIPFVRECFSSIGEVELLPGREITAERLRDAHVLLVRSVTPVNAELLEQTRVRFVATATIGFDHVDTDYLRANGIGFASAPGANSNSAAEYVIAGILEVAQKYRIKLEGKSIGVIGAGNVGSKVAKKCAALGMEVRLNDPPLARQTADEKYLPIEALLDCDFITLHTPLTYEGRDKTHHLADDTFFKALRPGCVFINSSRGAVVDSEALKSAIRSARLGAVVLDVWENEPDIDTELLKMVDIGTPHIAGYSLDGKVAGMIMTYEATCQYFGLEAHYRPEDFLPQPQVPELRVEPGTAPEQEVLIGLVQRIYDIRRDDVRLRRIRECKAGQAGQYFDNLRKEYPVRREFHNTKVVLERPSPALARQVEGIGFRLAVEGA